MIRLCLGDLRDVPAECSRILKIRVMKMLQLLHLPGEVLDHTLQLHHITILLAKRTQTVQKWRVQTSYLSC